MDRIQEAIEKAQKQQANSAYNETGNEKKYNPVEDNGIATPSMEPIKSLQALNFAYSTTRVINFTDKELKERRIVAGLEHDARSEPYRQLRSQVLKELRKHNLRTLAITSPNEGNGKTLTAVNLAISLSKEVNQTVMLVDLDLRTPSVAKTMGFDNIDYGIADTLNDSIKLENILINPGYERLVIAPGTSQGQHTSEILSSPAMRSLQDELYHRYEDRIILYDLPCLLSSDDALVFAPKADATLLIIEDGATKKDELQRAVRLLKDANVIGTVINKVR